MIASRAFAGGVEVDGATHTTLDSAPNGVPVVNIANPNARGLSHNTYRQFNVEKQGLILNNSTQATVRTQLGGYILGNPNLGSSARIILNEVTSTNPSVLRGYTEAAGVPADVVIANPNGISVNGAGFINIPRITLTTGVPGIDAQGNLVGFDVRGGEIAIEGDGLDSLRQDSTSIYTRYLQLNAKLHAKDLDIALGNNEIDYPGRKIVRSSSGTGGRLLLDSSALGGLYANKIRLVGTEQGLGVNLPPEVIAAHGDIMISNDGRIVLQQLDAGGSIALHSSSEIDSGDTVYGARDVTVSAARVTVREGMLGAGSKLTIRAGELDNRADILAGLQDDGGFDDSGDVSIMANSFYNRGHVFATGGIESTGIEIANLGLVNASGDLAITADRLANESTLFAGGSMRLHLRDSLDNRPGAAIFAVGDLVLGADHAGGRTGRISNDLALIQSYEGDIDIHAVRFENLGFADIQYELIYYDLGNGREVSDPLSAMTIDLAYSTGYTKHRSTARRRWVNEILSRLRQQAPQLYSQVEPEISSMRSARFLAIETRMVDLSITTPSMLDSGGDLSLHVDDFLNRDSIVAAANDIRFDIANAYVNDVSAEFENVVDYQYYTRADHSRNWKSDDKYSSLNDSGYVEINRRKKVSSDAATQAGGSISGEIGGQAVNNGVLQGKYHSDTGIDPDSFNASGISLPSGDFGLFVKSTAPDSSYLIETNPRFTHFADFIGSDYLLSRLDYSGNETLKRLGDAFYEAKLIRDEIFALTGRRYLDTSIASDNAQFRHLMDNAIAAERELELTPGVMLTTAQIDDLTRDIVWLEVREVAGERVLVPRVYLANGPRSRVRGGRIVAGENVQLHLAALDNEGLIESAAGLEIVADDSVTNRGAIAAGGDLQLEAGQSIKNISGRIEGENLNLRANEGSIVHRRATEDYVIDEKRLRYSTTQLGDEAVIVARNRLELEAADRISVQGSRIGGRDIAIEAAAVDIEAARESEDFYAGDGDGHLRGSAMRHFAATVEGGDIVILSPGSVRVEGSRVAAQDRLQITAGAIDVASVSDGEFFAVRDTDNGVLSESLRSVMSYRGTNRASELTGTTVVLITEQGDIELSGSNIHAGDRLEMTSAGAIRVRAGKNERFDETYERESGWLSGGSLYSETEDLEGRLASTAVNSEITAGSARLEARDEIGLQGVEIAVGESLEVTAADIAVRNSVSEEHSYSKHKRIDLDLGDVAGGLADSDRLDIDDGKLTLKLGDAAYEYSDSSTTQTTVVASTVEAGNLVFEATGETRPPRAGNRGQTGGDIRVEGSDLGARDTIELLATGDVALLDAEHTRTTESKSQQGTAALNFVLKNEYDQAVRALKAVKEAERNLRHAREAYDAYQDELAAQEANLRDLEQQLAAKQGYIESSDVRDFERRLDRLRDDEEFYQANIALAAATLASQTTALFQQVGKAASSSATYGFNMGLELDVDALEEKLLAMERQSRGSSLYARDIDIVAADTARVRGSNLLATDNIDIEARDIVVEAGVSASRDRQLSQQVNFTYRWDLLGTDSTLDPEDLGGGLAGEGSRSSGEAVEHVNSQIRATNIRLEAEDETRIEGAEIIADERLEIAAGDLRVASVQDSSYSDSHSIGLNLSEAGGGIDAAVGEGESISTLTTRLGGQSVDIRVSQHTDIRGAIIAATDADGADNGQLSLSTGTLGASSLIDTVSDSNRSTSLQGGEFSSLDYEDDAAYERVKTLATIGSGDILIGDRENSDTRMLNTDIENTQVSIYDLESGRGLAGELDTRLLSEAGRNQIAEDWLKSGLIANTIELIATTERVGIEDFFDETARYNTAYEVVKTQIGNDPALAAMLQSPALTPAQKEYMLNQLVGAVAAALDYEGPDNVIIATETKTPEGYDFYGFYSTETGQAYINDINNHSTKDLIVTAGHESVHAMDDQAGIDINSPDYDAVDNAYATDFGLNLAEFADFALDYHGHDGLAQANDHTGNDSDRLRANNSAFSGLDKEQGDFRLTEQQKLNQQAELDACSNLFCAAIVKNKYTLVSSAQGIAEATGVVSGALNQFVNDVQELVKVTDELLNDPEKAEQVAAYLSDAIVRANEVIDGDQLTFEEKKQFVIAVNAVAAELMSKADDGKSLDGPGFDASFGEGEKYGGLVASIIPLSKISKILRGLDSKADKIDSLDLKLRGKLDPDNDFRVDDAEVFRLETGGSIKPYLRTNVNNKVKVVDQEELPLGLQDTYRNREYITVETTQELKLYRKFGGTGEQAKLNGSFAGSESGLGRSELAVYKNWNTMRFEAEISVPIGQKLNIGRVAEQPLGAKAPKYRGNSDQILLPRNYPLEWIKGVRDGKTGRAYTLQEFKKLFPEQFNSKL